MHDTFLLATFRSRGLLDLAHKITECQNCGRYCPDGCEPAHANWAEYGKGKSIKAHDCFHAALCHPCHVWLDQSGSGTDPSGCYDPVAADKKAMWTRAAFRTLLIYWQRGWIRVSA